jgi:hypothetical protein
MELGHALRRDLGFRTRHRNLLTDNESSDRNLNPSAAIKFRHPGFRQDDERVGMMGLTGPSIGFAVIIGATFLELLKIEIQLV